MTITRRQFGARTAAAAAAAAVSMPYLGSAARAQAVTTLRLHHFLPPASNAHAKRLAPWARKGEAESHGTIKIMPSIAVARPIKVSSMMSAAQIASAAGLRITACQLVSTACITVARRSSNIGMDTTLEANKGAAIRPPSVSHSSNK